jgi:uncharacterized protein (TIRG00374 family)
MTVKNKYRAGLGIGFRYLIGLVVIAWLWHTDLIDVRVFERLDVKVMVVGITLVIIQLLILGWRVQMLLAEQDIHASMPRCIAYNSVGIFYSVFLPGGMSGDLARAYCFWRAYPAASKSALFGALFLDRLIGTVVLLIIGLVAATYLMSSLGLQHFVLIAWCGLLLLIAIYFIAIRFSRYQDRYQGRLMVWLLRFIEKISHKEYSARSLIICALIALVGHFCAILLIYLCSDLMSSGLDLLKIVAVAPLGLLANALPITPGGLGIGEKGFDLLYKLVGGSAGGNSFLLARVFLFAPAILGAAIIVYEFIDSHYRMIAKWRAPRR